MLINFIILAAAYLIGSIPFGFLLVKLFRGVDVRDYGSNNVGAINVFRVGGKWLGALTLLFDIGKAVVVVVAASYLTSSPTLIAGAGMLALLGHAFSFWFYLSEHKFSEGKCVASSLGVLTGLAINGAVNWWVPVGPLAVWILGLITPKLLTRKWSRISPVTMTASSLIPVFVALSRPEAAYIWMSIGIAVLSLIRHKNNIRRLIAGQEPKIGESRVTA